MANYSAGMASPGSNYQDISTLAYDIVFIVGFILLTLLILVACRVCSRSEPATIPSHGINQATLSSFPKLSYSKAKLQHTGDMIGSGCPICLADYKDSDMLRSLPRCGHLFHVKCVDPWLRMHSTCPICRTSPGSPEVKVSIQETG